VRTCLEGTDRALELHVEMRGRTPSRSAPQRPRAAAGRRHHRRRILAQSARGNVERRPGSAGTGFVSLPIRVIVLAPCLTSRRSCPTIR
jgi:hypothetical protein